VHWLPLVVSFVVAAAITPATVRALARHGSVRENYRGAPVAFPAGVTIVSAALLASIVVAPLYSLVDDDVFREGTVIAVTFVLGVAFLGLLDDLAGSQHGLPRGWRGHFGALASGRLSTGAVKALGTLGLGLLVMRQPHADAGRYLLAVAVLVLATNLFNLLDLRPGRSAKLLILLGAGLLIASGKANPFWAVSLFIGPILVLLPLELRELAMLGDTGSNVIGAVAGVWLVLSLSTLAQGIAAAILVAITVYGEFRSISALIERTPGLRQLDSIGRSHA
jgi:UDP-GlcNAc:undecaprenyl-phosphate/decaprenyl-phosphate GlcNAc-1-phosphate transferase